MAAPKQHASQADRDLGEIRLRTLGETGLWAEDGQLLGCLLEKPKAFALLVYLACHPHRDLHQRESLMAVFWPDSDARRAANSLRQAIHVLRRSLPGGLVLSRRRSLVGLRVDRLDVDVRRFREAVSTGRLEEAALLYRGDFLDGFAVPGAPELSRWIDAQQRQIRRKAVDVLRTLAVRTEAREGSNAALPWWGRALELAPYDEAAATGLILALLALGRRDEAMGRCRRFIGRRQSELGLPPSSQFRVWVEETVGEAAATVA